MGMYKISIGDIRDTCHSSSIRHAVAEFISTLIFVFVGEGSGMAINKLSSSGGVSPAEGLITASLAHGFALFVGVSVAANKSGGHLNPAVTFGAFLGGHVTLLKMILFWIAQLLGSIVACGFLKFTTGGMQTSAFALSEGVTVWNAVVFEMVMTFGLVYTVYATAIDPKNGNLGILAPLAIGLMVGANILVGGAFEGASMNPAVSFGPAVVSWTWTHQWVYWVGPLIGGGIAAVIYDNLFISVGNCTKEQISAVDF